MSGTFGPPGTFLRAYQENRRAAREGILDVDPVAARVREIMARCSTWSGSGIDSTVSISGRGRRGRAWRRGVGPPYLIKSCGAVMLTLLTVLTRRGARTLRIDFDRGGSIFCCETELKRQTAAMRLQCATAAAECTVE